MEVSKRWTCVHELCLSTTIVSNKYVLSYSNWNDFGYQTLFGLHLVLNSKSFTQKPLIAGLSIVELYPRIQSKGRFFPIYGNTNFVSFIMSIESAECMYLTLTYEERIELIHMLRIKFDDSYVCKQGNYLTSTLRGITREDFLAMQQEIKRIIYTEHDVSSIVRRHFALSDIMVYFQK